MSERRESEERRVAERRKILELAGMLAVDAIDLSELCDAEARTITAIQWHIELLRTPTAPDVQRQVAAEKLRECLQEFSQLNERIRDGLGRFAQLVERERQMAREPW
jgi:hypothetical protein